MREENGRFFFEAAEQPSTTFIQATLAKAGFNPFQPRDYRGWWTRGGADARLEPIQYRGFFHNFMVDYLIDNFIKRGAKAVKGPAVVALDGTPAIPDGVVLVPGQDKPYFLEVKTGSDPDYTRNQKTVYPEICVGGHVTSFDSKIREVGLTPGQLMPPLNILVVYTAGPKMPMRFESYCQMHGLWRYPDAP